MGTDRWCLSLSAHFLGGTQSTLEWHMAEGKVQGTHGSGTHGSNHKMTGAMRCIYRDYYMYRSSSFLLFL